MIITESFVFLNYPKTGSTFVREALSELYANAPTRHWPWRKKRHFEMYMAPNVRDVSPMRAGSPNPHGTYWQIPKRARHLPVYSVFRDPLERVISAYYYADWKRQEGALAELDTIKQKYPSFPDLGILDYLEYLHCFYPRKLSVGGEIFGTLATDFVHFFLREVEKENQKTFNFSSLMDLQDSMGHVCFLDNSNLNQELADMLLKHGYGNDDVLFIREKSKSNVSKKSNTDIHHEMKEIVRRSLSDDMALIQKIVRVPVKKK